MHTAELKAAIIEAERFIQRGRALLGAVAADPVMKVSGASHYIGVHPKEQGAVSRASMDLTRALADLRRFPK